MKKLIAAIAGMLIFAGLPVIIWLPVGLDAFMAHPMRLAYLVLAVVAQVGVVLFVPNQGFSQAEGKVVVARQRMAVLLLQLVTVGIVIISPWTDSRRIVSLPDQVRCAGVGLYAAGFFLMNWSIIWLGRHFSVQVTIQEKHRLVTDGPYKHMRHPRYTGIMLCFLGIAFVFASAGGLFFVGLLIAILAWRIRDEEAFMACAFPAEWPDYCRRTSMLIPYVL